MGGCCPRLARPLARRRTDGPDWMDGGSARAFLRSFQSELVVRTEPFTFVRPSVAVVIVIVTVSLVARPVALAQRGRRKNREVRDGGETEWSE